MVGSPRGNDVIHTISIASCCRRLRMRNLNVHFRRDCGVNSVVRFSRLKIHCTWPTRYRAKSKMERRASLVLFYQVSLCILLQLRKKKATHQSSQACRKDTTLNRSVLCQTWRNTQLFARLSHIQSPFVPLHTLSDAENHLKEKSKKQN